MIWLLKARDALDKVNDPWEPWYDKYFGFVIRADSSMEARRIAHEYAKESKENRNKQNPWLEDKYSTCIEILNSGESEIILKDFHAA